MIKAVKVLAFALFGFAAVWFIGVNLNRFPEVQAQNIPKLTSMSAQTIAVTSTYQLALAQNGGRAGCTIQNNSATNKMFIFLGPAAPGSTATSFQLAAGAFFYCQLGGISITDAIWITGTNPDVAIVAAQ